MWRKFGAFARSSSSASAALTVISIIASPRIVFRPLAVNRGSAKNYCRYLARVPRPRRMIDSANGCAFRSLAVGTRGHGMLGLIRFRRPSPLATPVGSAVKPMVAGANAMSFATRAIISLLAGIGAGLLGFWGVWRCLIGTAWDPITDPGCTKWLLAGIFIPGVLVPLAVFHRLGQATSQKPAEAHASK
jgi:hypothetical protein